MMDGTPVSEGTYVIEDGRSVTVDAEGVITSIVEPSDDDMEALKAENEDLKAKIEKMEAEASKQTELLNEVKDEVAKLAKMSSTYKPKPQTQSFRNPETIDNKDEKESYNAIKARREEKRNQAKK